MDNELNNSDQQVNSMGLVMSVIAWVLLLAMLGFYFQDKLASYQPQSSSRDAAS